MILNIPAPSILAASSNSLGIDLKVCRNKNIPKPDAMYGKPIASIVSIIPRKRIVL